MRIVCIAVLLLCICEAAEAEETAFYFSSSPNDYIGGGQQRYYAPPAMSFTVTSNAAAGRVSFSVDNFNISPFNRWSLNFAAANDMPLLPGRYTNAVRYPFQDASKNGLSISGEARGCNQLTGEFTVLEAAYGSGGNVIRFAADFIQHCEGRVPALYGGIRYNSTIINPVPALVSLSPSHIPADSAFILTVNGANFIPGSYVRWNGIGRPTTLLSSNQMTAAIPIGNDAPGSAEVSIFNPGQGGGSSNPLSIEITNPIPKLSLISPLSATAGSRDLPVTLTGSNFIAGSVVQWNGQPRDTTFGSSTRLTAAIPADDLTSPGGVKIAVSNPAPGGGLSNALDFNITNWVPGVTSLAPSTAGAGDEEFSLIVTGYNFFAGSVVRWNRSARPTAHVSSTQLLATISAADIAEAGNAEVSVFNPEPGGGTSFSMAFSIGNRVPDASLQDSWSYSSYFGSFGSDSALATAADGSGNIYVAGYTSSFGGPFTDAPGGSGSGFPGVFLLKFNSKGQLLYNKAWKDTTSFGALHVDVSGNVYLTGLARSTFPTTPTAFQPNSGAASAAFVLKLAPAGSVLFSTFFGGMGSAINTDTNGTIAICGSRGGLVTLTSGAYKSTPTKSTAAFCSKISADGKQLLASTLFGSEQELRGFFLRSTNPAAVTLDADGNFLVAGSVSSPGFPVTAGFQPEDRRRSLFQRSGVSPRWTAADDGRHTTITSIEYDRQDPQRMFAASDSGVFRSQDGGTSWDKINAEPTMSLKVHPLNAIYQVRISYQFLLQKSRDGGITWSPVGLADDSIAARDEFLAADQIAADFSDEGSFFVVANVNSGYSGTIRINVKTGSGARSLPVFCSAIMQTNASILFCGGLLQRSFDAGKTFQELPFFGRKVWPAPSDHNVVYAFGVRTEEAGLGAVYRFFRSDDGGMTWKERPAFPFKASPNVYVDPESAEIIFGFSTKTGIQRSTDGGQTWDRFDTGIFNSQVRTVAKTPSGRLWAGTSKNDNGFIVRISADATQLLYSSLFGGSGGATITRMLIDDQGRKILSGSTSSTDLIETTETRNPNPYAPGFVAVLDADLSALEVFRRLDAAPSAMRRGLQNRLHLAGTIDSDALNLTSDAEQQQYGGSNSEGFWLVLDRDYNHVLHSTYLGGSGADTLSGLALLPDGRAVLAGFTSSADFPVTIDAIQTEQMILSSSARDTFLTISRNAEPTDHPITFNIPGRGARTFVTPGLGMPITTGYADVVTGSSPAPYGTAVFSLKQNGVRVSEAGVPASRLLNAARIFIDVRNNEPAGSGTINVNTGIAIANPGDSAATVSFTLRDTSGRVLATGAGPMMPGQHLSRFITELESLAPGFVVPADFPTTTQFGTLDVSSTQPFSMVVLRLTASQRGEALITTVPVADLDQPLSTGGLTFPQFVDGGGYTTTIVLFNTSSSPEIGTIRFRDDSGSIVPVTLNGIRNTISSYSIPVDGAVVLETSGNDAQVAIGSIEVAPDGGTNAPTGAGVFRLIQNGTVVTESGVPAGTPSRRMRIYVDTSNGHNTGIAVANPTEGTVTLSVSAFQIDGISIPSGTSSLTLPPKGHIARFVTEMFPYWPAGQKGVIEITASTPATALTLRSLSNERGEFLITTFPVANLESPAPTPIVFPQVADGGGYTTEIILIGPGELIVPATVRFFNDDGTVMPLNSN